MNEIFATYFTTFLLPSVLDIWQHSAFSKYTSMPDYPFHVQSIIRKILIAPEKNSYITVSEKKSCYSWDDNTEDSINS